jgi:chromosome partitioning protein
MTVLTVYSHKGGVGKTAAAVNLAYLAAQSGIPTLICDLDAQSSSTYYFRIKPKLKGGAKGLLQGSIGRSIKGTDYEDLDLLPADLRLRDLALALDGSKHTRSRLRRVLKPLQKEYQLIVLDAPPTIGLLAENVFDAADYLLVPLIPTPLSLRTHYQLLHFLDDGNYDTSRVHAFFSLVDNRKKLHREQMAEALAAFPGTLRTAIPYLAQIERMGVERQPVPAFAPRSTAATYYQSLWQEVAATLFPS